MRNAVAFFHNYSQGKKLFVHFTAASDLEDGS